MANNYYPDAVKKYKAKAYKRITVEYKRELIEAFEEQLKKDGIKKAEFFRNAITKYLEENNCVIESSSTATGE